MLCPLHSSHLPSDQPSGLPEKGHWITVPTGTLLPAGATAVTDGGEKELLSAARTGENANTMNEVAAIKNAWNWIIDLL